MADQPSPAGPVSPSPEPQRFNWNGYFRSLWRILAADVVVVVVLTLVFGARDRLGFSNYLFFSAFFLLLLAAVPGLGSMRSNISLTRPLADSPQGLRERMKANREKQSKDEPTTFALGTAGLLALLLSIVISY